MKIWIIYFIFLIGLSVMADEPKKTIDVGELQVEGSVRKPMVIKIQGDQDPIKHIENVLNLEIQKIEQEIFLKENSDEK